MGHLRTLGLLGGLVLLTGLSQCENQTCFDFDEDGNRIEFPCTSCNENDENPCTLPSWRIEPGETCSLDQQPLVPDGQDCESEGVAGICVSGTCEEPAQLEMTTGTTTWAALTTPPGGGTPPAVTGGCEVFTDVGPTVVFQVTVELEVRSLGNNEIETSWTLIFENPLFGALQNAADLGELELNAVLTNALGGPIASSLTDDALGQRIGAFYVDSSGPLLLESSSTTANPDGITTGQATVTPTVSPGSSVNVNWDGKFTFDWTLGGMPLVNIDETTCDFNVVGTGVNLPTGT